MGTINVNGTNITYPNGANVNIVNGEIIVDGKKVHKSSGDINVTIDGDVGKLDVTGSATIHGSVLGDVDAGNSVKCGDVEGNVDAGNSIKAKNINGKAKAGNTIHKSFL